MPVVRLESEIDFAGWRTAARALRARGIAPREVTWAAGQGDLFEMAEPAAATFGPAAEERFSVPKDFIDLAEAAICHRDPSRFHLLYVLLCRLRREPELMHIVTDDDVARLRHMAREVHRACHKMKAFVRFREVAAEPETYAAWFEPPHRVLERTAPFFVGRFANLRFSILTPDACAHWDGEALRFTPGADRASAPSDDVLEDYWRTYYASIFNPARLKVAAMQAEMPKRYWRNLPEAALIPSLIAQAQERQDAMVRAEPSEPRKRAPTTAARPARAPTPDGAVPASLAEIAELIQGCRRCDLWRNATQGIPGQGPGEAKLMLVGEQPGDQEDLAGRPFVGPAGQMLDRALAEAGVPRAETYVTNAVKHFKHEPRGKRRLHKTPDSGEIAACRWWLDHERRFVRPRLILAMGGSAALSVLGKPTPIGKSRGVVFQLDDQAQAMVTMHPSYLLRIPDAAAKAEAYGKFVEDLAAAWKHVA
jgi:probable DNA metabolism protein